MHICAVFTEILQAEIDGLVMCHGISVVTTLVLIVDRDRG